MFNSTGWSSPFNTPTTGVLTFMLNSSLIIQGMALWNDNGDMGINRFELFADSNGNIDDGLGKRLGTFDATQRPLVVPAQTFSFDSVQTQFVHLNIISGHALITIRVG